jgi:8-oxo-dGTP pyrophosphatase MutT (NUDIX family)
MHRRPLLNALSVHQAFDSLEAEMLERMRDFVGSNADCFERTLTIGHVTGAAWIVNRQRTHALLTHHRKLELWLQLGGHCDGDADTRAVALREATEESGLVSVRVVSPAIFDVDVHRIPARPGEPEHYHYDVRYLFEADDRETPVVSEESLALAWVPLDGLGERGVDESVLRLARKAT